MPRYDIALNVSRQLGGESARESTQQGLTHRSTEEDLCCPVLYRCVLKTDPRAPGYLKPSAMFSSSQHHAYNIKAQVTGTSISLLVLPRQIMGEAFYSSDVLFEELGSQSS